MTEPPDPGARPEQNWRDYLDFDGRLVKFNVTAEVRLNGFWVSLADDYPPRELMIRLEPLLYLLWGDRDSGYRRIRPSEAREWFAKRREFARGRPAEARFATPADLESLADQPGGEVPTPTADAERELAAALKSQGKPTRAKLVEHMIGKPSASREDVGEHVHDFKGTSAKTIAQNCRYASHDAEALGSPLRYHYAAGMVHKTGGPR
jgi:hypothetical protein